MKGKITFDEPLSYNQYIDFMQDLQSLAGNKKEKEMNMILSTPFEYEIELKLHFVIKNDGTTYRISEI